MRQPGGVGGDVAEEAGALRRAHGLEMVLQQLHRPGDAGQRGLELVADRGGEVAQVARTAGAGLGHGAEVRVEAADLRSGDARRRRDVAGAGGYRAGGGAQALDRSGHPA